MGEGGCKTRPRGKFTPSRHCVHEPLTGCPRCIICPPSPNRCLPAPSACSSSVQAFMYLWLHSTQNLEHAYTPLAAIGPSLCCLSDLITGCLLDMLHVSHACHQHTAELNFCLRPHPHSSPALCITSSHGFGVCHASTVLRGATGTDSGPVIHHV